jgi:hypothetical protein
MDSSQSQEEGGLYAGFTCTSVKPEPDGVVIEVDYDKCKKVAFAEDLDLKGSEAIVNYPLYKLYDILKEKSKIKLTSKDYVFITWLQPIPPTFHTINQVKYIADIVKKLMKINVNIVAIPYIYLYYTKYTESISEKLYELYKDRWSSLDYVKDEAFEKKLELLITITRDIPTYPSLIIHTISPSVLGVINTIYNNSPLVDLKNLREWSMGLLGSDKLAEFAFSLLEEKGGPLPPETKQEITMTISSVYKIIPDAPPPNVALSILFPILTSRNLENPKILLFGITPRDIVYYTTLLQFIKDGSKLKENIYYIPTRSIMRYYKEESGYYTEKKFRDYLKELKQKIAALNAFSTENGVSIPRILLFYELIKELGVICYGDSDPDECKVLDRALKVYNKIKDHYKAGSASSLSLNLFHLIHKGSITLENLEIKFGFYASEINEVVYSYIMYMRKKGSPGRTRQWAPEVWISQNPALKVNIWPKAVDLGSNIPLGSAFGMNLGSEITKDEEGILGGKIGDASFWLVNVLYFFIARLKTKKRKRN